MRASGTKAISSPTRGLRRRVRSAPAPERKELSAVPPPATARSMESLSARAYDRIEQLIVHCRLKPGANTTMKELQSLVDVGRTPVHQAVRRLAAETLIRIRPRDGLQIAPIDLQRDRRLLVLRREMDRFVAELATERLTANQRNQLIHLGAKMRDRRASMDIWEFNGYDRDLDTILLAAAAEPFLDRTLRPLHTIFRRTGQVHLRHVGEAADLSMTIDCHLALLEAVVARLAPSARAASDRLVDFAGSMLERLEGHIDPRLLDARA